MLYIRYNGLMDLEKQRRTQWYEFANHAFMEWRGNTRKTISEFAEWVGVSQPVMSSQLKMGGKLPRDQKTITAWVSRYG
jgi:uncharacterized protein (UPF0276 family)